MKVKCINNKMAEDQLVIGNIYIAQNYDLEHYAITLSGGAISAYRKDRFEIVPDPFNGWKVVEDMVINTTIPATTNLPKVDVEEEACWRAMLPRLSSPDNCKCDMLRSKCPYHKD
jgi:hypothetical protein